jgi:hypothetical protein
VSGERLWQVHFNGNPGSHWQLAGRQAGAEVIVKLAFLKNEPNSRKPFSVLLLCQSLLQLEISF